MSIAATRESSVRPGYLIWLVLSALLHLAFVYYVPAPSGRSLPQPAAKSLTVTLTMPQKTEREMRRAAPVPAAPAHRARQKEVEARPERSDITSSAPGAEQAISLSPPAEPRGSLMLDARRAVGGIDRELRRAFPTQGQPQRAPDSIQRRLEKGIAAAGPAPGMVERTLADGRRVTRVSGPTGVYCVTQDSVGANDGIDHIQGGMRNRVTDCGHLFD